MKIKNLDHEIAEFVLPKLKEFRKNTDSIPYLVIQNTLKDTKYWPEYRNNPSKLPKIEREHCEKICSEEWDRILGVMIESFELILSEFDHTFPEGSFREYKIQCGLDLFAKYFRDL